MKKIMIVLVQTPSWPNTTPSLTLAYLTANIRNEHREVKQLHLNIKLFEEEKDGVDINKYLNFKLMPKDDLRFISFNPHFKQDERDEKIVRLSKKWAERIVSMQPTIVGFAVTGTSRLFSLLISQRIKELDKDIIILFGGAECQFKESGLFIINSGFVDGMIIGEGEETFRELVESVEQTGWIKECPGTIIKKKDGTISEYIERPLIKNLASLKYPEFNEEDIKNSVFPFMLPMMSSRGCVARCSFCNEQKYWKYYRFRKVEDIISEIKHQKEKYFVKTIRFNDSLINGNMKILEELCDHLIEEKINITWMGNARFDDKLTFEFLQKMYKAGCRELLFGMESGSPDVLKLMNKKNDININRRIVRDAKRAGILPFVYVITGFPNENPEDFLQTIHFLADNNKEIVDFSFGFLYISQNNNIFERQEEFGIRFYEEELNSAVDNGIKRIYTKSDNPNFNDGHKRAMIIDSIFRVYKTNRNVQEYFLENKPLSGPRNSILMRDFLLNNKFYSSKGNLELQTLDSETSIQKGSNYHVTIKVPEIALLKEKLMVCKPERLFIKFVITEDEFITTTGEKIILFLKWLEDNKISYKVTKPLPRCIFGPKYEILTKKFKIPLNCLDCLEFLKINEGRLLFCNKQEFGEEKQTEGFQTCNKCIHKMRNTCNGFCL